MSLLRTFRFIVNHAMNRNNKTQALWRFVRWQLRLRLNSAPVRYRFTERSILVVQKGMTGATGNLYCGLHEFSDMGFLLHFLRKGDLFVDIGANVGSYTVLASAQVGAFSISIEPVPTTYGFLVRNIEANQLEGIVEPRNMGLSSNKGEIKFTAGLDTVNHVAIEGEADTITVPVDTLDKVLNGRKPALLKIDVEGFETEVIKGASDTLADTTLKAIIIELNGSGERYGYDERFIHDVLIKQGFCPSRYDPESRVLTPMEILGEHNTIYIRDIAAVQEKLTTADKVKVINRLI